MSLAIAHPWMLEQRALGHTLCLLLDAQDERATYQALLNRQGPGRHYNLYRETQAANLAEASPYLFLVDSDDMDCLTALLAAPQRNWGWLASVAEGDVLEWVKHWRARLIIGSQPHQALYRFHDNRVLGRALQHLTEAQLPAYLGPAISVCYWQDEHWQLCANPKPGRYPLPEPAPWLQVPTPAGHATDIRTRNAHRYLLDQHLASYLALAEQQDPKQWLAEQLALADAWGWDTPAQLAFLLSLNLNKPAGVAAERWQPQASETPRAHFERLSRERQFWQGAGRL
ncbi:MAG: DUF4123 domain-containing protein [Pseudomonas sp.]